MNDKIRSARWRCMDRGRQPYQLRYWCIIGVAGGKWFACTCDFILFKWFWRFKRVGLVSWRRWRLASGLWYSACHSISTAYRWMKGGGSTWLMIVGGCWWSCLFEVEWSFGGITLRYCACIYSSQRHTKQCYHNCSSRSLALAYRFFPTTATWFHTPQFVLWRTSRRVWYFMDTMAPRFKALLYRFSWSNLLHFRSSKFPGEFRNKIVRLFSCLCVNLNMIN